MHPDPKKVAPRDPVEAQAQDTPAQKKRFSIERLEQRIAPKKGGNGTHHCGGGSSNTISSSGTY